MSKYVSKTEEYDPGILEAALEDGRVAIAGAEINRLSRIIYERNVKAGWYTDLHTGKPKERNVGEVIALMHSELSEALEGYRKNLMDTHLPNRKMIEVEFADTIIRILDTCGAMGLDVGSALVEKLEYNRTRADHQVENRKKAGGKVI